VALQAYIDDSGRGQHPAFVLAGWIARPEQWADFSTEWEKVLHLAPLIKYLKTREAMNFQGQFNGWSKTDRNNKLADLYAVIEQYVMNGIYIVIPSLVFEQYASIIDHPKANDPYFLASFSMMVMVSDLEEKYGITEPVDFIFDNQEGMEIPVRDAWNELRSFSPDGVRRRLGRRPEFDDDKVSMPLQAADLHAWWVRRGYSDMVEDKERLPTPWKHTKDLYSISIIVAEEQIADFFAPIATTLRAAWTFSWGLRRFIQYAHWRFAVELPFERPDQIGLRSSRRRVSKRFL
jgi:hypothetical protein